MEQRTKELKLVSKKLRELAQKECDCVGDDKAAYKYNDTNIPKAKDRLEILDKIKAV